MHGQADSFFDSVQHMRLYPVGVALAPFVGQGTTVLENGHDQGGQIAAAQVMALMDELNRESGTTLVLVTHDERLAARCQRQLRIEAGRLSETARDAAAGAVPFPA